MINSAGDMPASARPPIHCDRIVVLLIVVALFSCVSAEKEAAVYAIGERYFTGLTSPEPTQDWLALFPRDSDGATCLRESLEWRRRMGPGIEHTRRNAVFLTGGSLQATLRYEVQSVDTSATIVLIVEEKKGGQLQVARCAWLNTP